jgi:hypothetical protein
VAGAILGSVGTEEPLLARRLAGIMTTDELLAAGRSANQIRTLVRRGTLMPLGRGVFADAAKAAAFLGTGGDMEVLRLAAALAVLGPGAVVSHQSAARLRGISLLGHSPAEVTLTQCRDRGWKARTGMHIYAAEVPPEHVSSVWGLPVTTAARTAVDLARMLDFRAGVVAADSALRAKASKDDMRSVIVSCHRWPGLERAREAVEFADMRAESPLESIARVLFRDCGFPPPDLQVRLGGRIEPLARVDFYWQQYRTIAEVDGGLKYSDPARAKAQLRRDSDLRAEGFEVVHFDWHDVTQAPARVAAVTREAFRRGQIGQRLARTARTAGSAGQGQAS